MADVPTRPEYRLVLGGLVVALVLVGLAATGTVTDLLRLRLGQPAGAVVDVAAGAVTAPPAAVPAPETTPTPTPALPAAAPTPAPAATQAPTRPASEPTAEPTAGPTAEPTPRATVDPADAAAGVLPGEVPTALGGSLVVVPGYEPAPGPGPVRTVRVEVEQGLPIDPEAFARFVMATLNDPRGWGADGSVSFARVDDAAHIGVLVASPATIDRMCAPLATNGKWSCGRYGHAALNAVRWAQGAPAFLEAGGDLTTYRQYLVNHEVGHLLGAQHTGCPTPGTPAPIMLQQSLWLKGCIPNGWPFP